MRYYEQSKLFQVLLSAARSGNLKPDAELLAAYKKERFQQAVKALRSRNIFLYTEGSRLSVSLNSINTIYTQPAGARMIILAYANNLRYGMTAQPAGALAYPQTHRIRIVGQQERAIVRDLIPSQAGISCEPRWTVTPLTVPVIIERQEQIAIDLGYDTAASASVLIPPQAFIFFAVKVIDKLTPQDYEVIDDLQRYINNVDYQRGIFLNCESAPNANQIVFSTALAGGTAKCTTRPANRPLLISAIGTSLRASKFTITDSSDGHSFSLNQPMQSSALNMPDFESIMAAVPPFDVAPSSAPIFTEYWQLAVPHLLRSGAQLQAEIVNGGDKGAGAGTVIDMQSNNVLLFQGITV